MHAFTRHRADPCKLLVDSRIFRGMGSACQGRNNLPQRQGKQTNSKPLNRNGQSKTDYKSDAAVIVNQLNLFDNLTGQQCY